MGELSLKEIYKTDLYQCFSNNPKIIRLMEKYQEANISRRKLCEEIVRLLHGWGFGSQSLGDE